MYICVKSSLKNTNYVQQAEDFLILLNEEL